ncbi:transposase [Streptomyces sp. NPDC058457]|uniref:transposase n=1 Tax=Streptomyces sp. NPDC058457 TaxID=3346507 RepID=UPI0036504483
MATVHRCVREAVGPLATLVPTLQQALDRAASEAFVILDDTRLPSDRIATGRPFHSGRHRKHGMHVQALADPFGRLLRAYAALPGTGNDIKAARTHRIIDALGEAGLTCESNWHTERESSPNTSSGSWTPDVVLAGLVVPR